MLLSTDAAGRRSVYPTSNDTAVNWQLAAFHINAISKRNSILVKTSQGIRSAPTPRGREPGSVGGSPARLLKNCLEQSQLWGETTPIAFKKFLKSCIKYKS